MKKRIQTRYLHLLLNDAIKEKKTDINSLTNETLNLKKDVSTETTWMKFKLICFSINRLLRQDNNETVRRHQKKLSTLIHLKRTAECLTDNPNETILNLTGQTLTDDQLEVLKLGLQYGLATRPNHLEIMSVAEDIWDQVSRLDGFKEGRYVQDKVKNSLRSFTYNYIDLDLKELNLDSKRIRLLRNLNTDFAILKPDKGNSIVLMKQSDYVNSVISLFTGSSKFKKIMSDPTPNKTFFITKIPFYST